MNHSRRKDHLLKGIGANFATVFPIWDIIFGTYYWDIDEYPETGVIDEKQRYKNPGSYWDLMIKGFKDFFNQVLFK